MKKLLVFIITLLPQIYLCAQAPGRVQLGNVRSQSYTGKSGSPIKGAIIRRKDGNVSPAYSDVNGNFGLSMENIGTKDDLYYIGSVEVGNKSNNYELFYPLPDDVQQYKPNSKLIIIMHSEAEWNDYEKRRMAATRNYYAKLYADSLSILNNKVEKSIITEQERDSISNELFELLQNAPKLMEAYLRNIEAKTDYESLDSTKQEIRKAIYENNIDYAKQLLAGFGSFDENYDEYVQLDESEKAIREIKKKKADDMLFSQNQKIEIGLKEGDFESVLQSMRNRLRVSPDNVNYLCELGQLEELSFNLYDAAKTNYSKALEQAILQNLSNRDVAICNNHLGDVYNAMSEYTLAEEQYNQARQLLEVGNGEVIKDMFDTYLGLGNVNYSQARFEEALSYYKKCAVHSVSSINRKAYLQGRIGIGHVKLAKGDYHGARTDFSSVLKEIVSIQDIDIVTLSMAYSSMIECMTTIGQYQEGIDSCDAAISIIQKHSSPKNTYIANLLIQKGNAYISIGKIKEGELCMNEAIDIYKNILGESHPNYAGACVLFADYYNLIGELHKSEKMSNKALEIYNDKFGKNHLATIKAHFSKCQLYQTYAEFEKAQAELDTIRTIYKSAGLLDDYKRIQISTCEAAIKIALGEQAEGIKIFQEAIYCVTKTLGNESVQLISIYNQIAMVHLEQLENEKAKFILDKAQSLNNKIFGTDSPTAIMQQMGMGQYYVNQGDYRKAYELYSKIEKSAIEIFGEDNYQLCVLYNFLGDYHLGQYHFDKAKSYYEKLYEIIKNTYGENHVYLAAPITKFGAYNMQVGDFYKGLENEQQAYSILSSHFGIGHKATLQARLGICSAYLQLGQFDQAESLLEELSKAVEKKLGKNHWAYSNVLQIVATLYQSKGEYSKAIKCIEDAIIIIEKIYGQHHSNTQQLYEQLGALYSKMCDFPKAMDYNNIAISIATNYYGKDNVGVMPFLLGKGQLYANLNQIKEAHNVYDKVKSTFISHWGDSCKQLNSVLISEAQLLMQEGYGEQALNILKNVESQMISMYGENSVQMCGVYNPLADAYQSVMRYKKAREYYQKSLDIVKMSLGNSNINCIHPLVGLGNVCLAEDATGQQVGEASRYFSMASFISSSAYGSNNANTATVDAMLGQISLRQGNLQDAYNKFQKFSMSVRQTLGEKASAHTRVAEAHMNFGYYYISKAYEALCRQDSVNTRNYALQAMSEFENAKNITEKIYGKDFAGVANTLDAIVQVYLILQQPDFAKAICTKRAEITIEQFGKHSPLVAQAYATLGSIYEYESDQIDLGDEEKLNEAKDCYYKAISIREKSPGNSNEFLMTSTMEWRFTLASIYMKLNDFDNAFKTIDKIIYELEGLQLDNKYGLYNCYVKKSSMILESERNPEEALELLLKAKVLFSELVFPNTLKKEELHYRLLFAFGNVYEKSGLTNEAIKNYEDAYWKLRVFPSNSQVDTMKQNLRDKIELLKSE